MSKKRRTRESSSDNNDSDHALASGKTKPSMSHHLGEEHTHKKVEEKKGGPVSEKATTAWIYEIDTEDEEENRMGVKESQVPPSESLRQPWRKAQKNQKIQNPEVITQSLAVRGKWVGRKNISICRLPLRGSGLLSNFFYHGMERRKFSLFVICWILD